MDKIVLGTTALAALSSVGSAVVGARAARAEGGRQRAVAYQNAKADEFDAGVALQNAGILEENARLYEAQATAIDDNAAFQVDRRHRDARELLSAQKARLAAMGVDVGTGSPLLIMGETVADAETDVALIRRQADYDAGASRTQGNIERQNAGLERRRNKFLIQQAAWQRKTGVSAARAGGVLAGAQILTGVTNAARIVGDYAGSKT